MIYGVIGFMVIFIIIIMIIALILLYRYLKSMAKKKEFFKKRKALIDENELYLTFDDGPSEYTNKLLDLLKEYNVKATFFCVADFANDNKKIIERMKNEGHEIELHSKRHKNALLQSKKETKEDLEGAIKIMKSLNVNVNFYRPPWGDTNSELIKELNLKKLKLIFWNVMAEDWEKNTTSKIIVKKLVERTQSRDIICLHDGRGLNNAPLRTIAALEKVIPVFLEEGYVFKKINEYEK